MRTWKLALVTLTIAVGVGTPATASAAFQHIVAQGETLSSVAAADGLSVSQLAAANGMSSDAQLVAGSQLAIPPQGVTLTSTSSGSATDADAGAVAAPSSGGGYVVQPGDTLSAIAGRLGMSVSSLAAANGLDPTALLLSGTTLHASGGSASTPVSSSVPASSSAGGYLVQPGDTLSAIAARLGVSVSSLAAANGLDPAGLLISGTSLHAAGASAPAPAPASTEMVSTSLSTGGGAQPTGEMVSASEVGSIASSEGVSPSLAEAIGYQESGFNNSMVSSTGATGVMQIMPGTWNYIGQNLAGPPPLSPTSVTDNIRAGSLLLHSLLNETGGDPAMAAAGYYQGLQSVREHGLFPDTQAYVNNVMALRQRFGG
jgi:N-acetylmuramoyl-L-alanine amidase